MADLVGDRLRQRDADPAEQRKPAQVDEQDREPATEPAVLEPADAAS